MSDGNTSQAEGAAASQATPATPVAAQPAPAQQAAPVAPAPAAQAAPAAQPAAPKSPPAASQGEPGEEPSWLKTRLERAQETARAAILKELGIEDANAAKAAIAAAKAAEEANKSAEQRATELRLKLDQEASQRTNYETLVKEQAGRMMMALTDEQRAAVTGFAGEDPVQQLKAIQHFGPTWAKQELAAREAAAALEPPPAQTSPAPGMAAPNEPRSPPDQRAVYQSAMTKNPFAAAAYGLRNPAVYERR